MQDEEFGLKINDKHKILIFNEDQSIDLSKLIEEIEERLKEIDNKLIKQE